MAAAIASFHTPYRAQARNGMVGLVREWLLLAAKGYAVPSVSELLAIYPSGEAGYWSELLDFMPGDNSIPIAQSLAIHAAPSPEMVPNLQRQLQGLLAPEHTTNPEALQDRLRWIGRQPDHAHLICDEVREFLEAKLRQAESPPATEPPESSPTEPLLLEVPLKEPLNKSVSTRPRDDL